MLAPQGQKRRRLVGDKMGSAADIHGALQRFFDLRGSRDLCGLLHDLDEHLSWKGAPKFEAMIKTLDFFGLMFDLFPNTVIPHAKLKAAIEGAHFNSVCIMSDLVFKLAVNRVAMAIRIGAAKWREVRACQDTKRIFLTKVIK